MANLENKLVSNRPLLVNSDGMMVQIDVAAESSNGKLKLFLEINFAMMLDRQLLVHTRPKYIFPRTHGAGSVSGSQTDYPVRTSAGRGLWWARRFLF